MSAASVERAEDNASRFDSPTLRELSSDFDGLKEAYRARIGAVETLAEERDKWYAKQDADRQLSVDKALAAVKEQTASAFIASKEAIHEAKKAQDSYNTTHNDLVRKGEAQAARTMAREEIEARFHSLDEKIGDMRDLLARGGGDLMGRRALKDDTRANLALLIAVLTTCLMFGTMLYTNRAAPQIMYIPAPNGTVLPSPPASMPLR